MAPTARLAEKLKFLGLTTDDNPASASKAPAISRKKVTFRVFFPLPPFEPGLHFNALKAGHGTYNFTGLLLGIGGKQLQKIKQESNARVEVVNAHGNLNGTHPDPLDEDLHALVTADNMVKLQHAVELVMHVLSPTNGSYEPVKVEAGGSARLKLTQAHNSQAVSAKTSGAPAKPKLTKPLPPVSSSGSRSRASLDGGSSSSCSTKGMPPSPALTPVTPAATGSRHGSMFASGSSGPSSCSSSRTPTPSPSVIQASCSREPHMSHTRQDCSSAAGSSASGDECSKDTHSHLEGFQLPPAALPAESEQSSFASEWPALPSFQDKSSSITTTSSSSSSNMSKPGLAAGVVTAGHSSSTTSASSEGSSSGSSRSSSRSSSNLKAVQPNVEYVSIPMSHLWLDSLDAQQPGLGCDSPQDPAQEATNEQAAEQQAGDSDSGCVSFKPAQQQSMLTYAGQAPPVISVDSVAASEHAMLSPLTPQAQQYQYQQKPQQRPKQQDAEQGQGAGPVLQANEQATGPESVFALGLDWQSAAEASGAVASLPTSVLQHGLGLCHQLNPLQQQQQPCDLDLVMLRQRAGLLSQAYLHCDSPLAVSGVSCACAGVAAEHVALCGPYACFDSSVNLMGPSTGGCEMQGLAGVSNSLGTVGGAVQESLEGTGFASQYAHQQMQDGFAGQDYKRQQREQHMRMMAGAAAAANYNSWDGGSSLSSSMPGGSLSQRVGAGGGQAGSLPHLGWDLTDYASRAQTAAVAAAASAAFGGPGMTDMAVAGAVLSSTCWDGGAGSLTAGGFLASNSIW